MRGRRLLGGAVVAALASLLSATGASAVVSNTPLSAPWVTNGSVNALAQMGSRLYLGGSFSFIGPETGPGALFDESKAGYAGGAVSLKPGFPQANGPINAVIGDGNGGFYVGGSFTTIGGLAQAGLAHVTNANQIDTTFAPAMNGSVDALARTGTQLFAGGSFNGVDGKDEASLVSLDPTTGAVTPGWVHSAAIGVDGTVAALALNGSTLYVGGAFGFALKGDGTSNTVTDVVGVNASNGVPVSPAFDPALDPDGAGVLAMQVVSISGTPGLLVGGDFQTPSTNLAAFKLSDSSMTIALSDYPNNVVRAIAYDTGTQEAWIGGDFSSVGASPRFGLAKYELPALDANWNPEARGGSVNALELDGSKLIFGGTFASALAGGNELIKLIRAQSGLGAVAASSATASPFDAPLDAWNPGAGGPVNALGLEGSLVFAGGSFASADGLPRANLAALDLPSGTGDKGFLANTDDQVWALTASASRLYAGGTFTTVDGVSAPSLAQLDPTTGGLASGFVPPLTSGLVEALAFSADGTKLYAGGDALGTTSGGVNLGAFNAATAAFEPGGAPDTGPGSVIRLLRSGNTVYAGGRFTQFGGMARSGLAAFSDTTGAVDASFAPSIAADSPGSAQVSALAVAGSRLYLGGQFTKVGGAGHLEIAAVNPTTGAVDNGWQANVDGGVTGLAVLSNHVYAAGAFQNAGPTGQRFGLAAFTLDTGALNGDWHPSLTGSAGFLGNSFAGRGHVLLALGNVLWLGDRAEDVNGSLRPGLGEFVFGAPRAISAPAVLGSPWPGQRMACRVGGFGGGPETYAFAWTRDGTAIPAATAQTFIVPGTAVGHRIGCRVTGANPAGSASAASTSVLVTHRPGGPKMKVAKSARASSSGVLEIKVTCPRGFTLCAGKLSVRTRGKPATSVGGGSFSVHGARSAGLRIQLSKTLFKRLKKQRSLTCTASTTAHDASARYATVTTKLTLLAPKRRTLRR